MLNKLILIFSLVLFSCALLGQSRLVQLRDYMGLLDLEQSPFAFHFRLWTDDVAIEIWQNEDCKSAGKITYWVVEYVHYPEKPTGRIFFKSLVLDSFQVQQITNLIDSSQITTLPDDYDIAGWNTHILDGTLYNIEIKDGKSYHHRTYSNPSHQDSIKEAITIQNFIDSTLIIATTDTSIYSFFRTIPFESYSNDGATISSRRLTRQQQNKYKRERNRYRKQQSKLKAQ